MITNTEIQQLRDALKNGTQGEWRTAESTWYPEGGGVGYAAVEIEGGSAFWVAKIQHPQGEKVIGYANAEQIVLSHNLLPSLLDSYEEMEREMEKMREALKRHGQHDLSCGVKHFIRWQHLDGKCETRTGECSCGLEAALSEAEAK